MPGSTTDKSPLSSHQHSVNGEALKLTSRAWVVVTQKGQSYPQKTGDVHKACSS